MRLTSEFWVSQIMRRVFNDGGYAAVMKKGASEAGAIFVKLQHRDGSANLYAPAPQTDYDSDKPQGRAFSLVMDKAAAAEIDERLEREARFDSDLWAVEIELGTMAAEQLFVITV